MGMERQRDLRAESTSQVRNPMTSKLCACYPLNVSLSSFSSLSAAVASTGTVEMTIRRSVELNESGSYLGLSCFLSNASAEKVS